MSKAEKKLAKAGIHEARKHLFFCIGPDCCRKDDGAELWEHAKKQTKGLPVPVMRTKAACFRVCCDGPWLVVYPDGTWYDQVTPERLDRILEQHVVGGSPVEEWVVATNSLGPDRSTPERGFL